MDIVAPGQKLASIEEIHDRRNIHVHRSGFADEQYQHRYPKAGFAAGDFLVVDEEYFLDALRQLDASALHIKQLLEKAHPTPPHEARRYNKGSLHLPSEPESLQFVSFRSLSPGAVSKYFNLEKQGADQNAIDNLVVWTSHDGNTIRMIIGGNANDVRLFRRDLHLAAKRGEVESISSFKIKRPN